MSINWSAIPNAEIIQKIRLSARTLPEAWLADDDDEEWTGWHEAFNTARARAPDEIVEEFVTQPNDIQGFAIDAIFGLLAWPDHAYMLDCDPDELKILSKFGSMQATLFGPVAIILRKLALQNTKTAV